MKIVALSIGIEKYLTNDFSSVRFAENDASAFVDKLAELGAHRDNISLIISNAATKATIQSKLNETINSLCDQDYFYLYYAGHGFSRNGENHITCSDTRKSDLINTSIRLQEVFTIIKNSRAQCAILFIDACQSGMPFDDDMRGLYSHLNDRELKDFFEHAKGTVCFSACKEDEYSYSHPNLKHGVWSYYVLKALSGDAKKAIERGKYITIDSLKNYLAYEVPLAVRNLHVGKKQTPWIAASLSSDFAIADVENILKQKIPAFAPLQNIIKSAQIESIRLVPIKSLSGFAKGHRVPDAVNDATQSFVKRISQNDMTEIANNTRDALRRSFGFKRREIDLKQSEDGADIITPYFDYHLSVSLNEEDTNYAEFFEFIDNISDGTIILSEQFDMAFESGFKSAEFRFVRAISVEELVDSLEDHGFTSKNLAYDKKCTYCELELKGYSASIRIEAFTIRFIAKNNLRPKELFSLVSNGVLTFGES